MASHLPQNHASLPDFTMPHLKNAKADVERAMAEQAKEPEKKADADLRLQREYTFQLDYVDGRGHHWKGTFTNRVLTIAQRMKVGVVRGRRQLGVPLEALMSSTIEIIYMVSWLEESLIGDRPKWSSDLMNLTDESILQAIFEEVSLHENTFHGRLTPAQKSQSESGDGGDESGALVRP